MPVSAELHLPDLPEVPVSLGPPESDAGAGPRAQPRWTERLRGVLSTYLPLLLMALLALGTWWLVKNSPRPVAPKAAVAPQHLPDYTVERFTIERYDPQGKRVVKLVGQVAAHYPDTDQIEIATVDLLADHPDGRQTRATARQAVANGDGSLVTLRGGAQVLSAPTVGVPVEIRGELLEAQVHARRVVAQQPVVVTQGASRFTADTLVYDQASGQLKLGGRVRAVWGRGPVGATP